MLFGWFGTVIREIDRGLLQPQGVDISFRMGMIWFIFSEVMFFAAFLGRCVRAKSRCRGRRRGRRRDDEAILWGGYDAAGRPTSRPMGRRFRHDPGVRRAGDRHCDPADVGVTSRSRRALSAGNRGRLLLFVRDDGPARLAVRVPAGHRVHRGLQHYNLKLDSGIYGSTFLMLTGFHGFHVTIGAHAGGDLVPLSEGSLHATHHFGSKPRPGTGTSSTWCGWAVRVRLLAMRSCRRR